MMTQHFVTLKGGVGEGENSSVQANRIPVPFDASVQKGSSYQKVLGGKDWKVKIQTEIENFSLIQS